jgi:hypothetical protein
MMNLRLQAGEYRVLRLLLGPEESFVAEEGDVLLSVQFRKARGKRRGGPAGASELVEITLLRHLPIAEEA